MEWYGKRAYVRQSGLGWGHVKSAMLDLLKDGYGLQRTQTSSRGLEPPTDNDSDDEDNDPAPPLIDDESEDENNDHPPPLVEDDDFDNESNDDSGPNDQLGAPSERDDYGQPHLTKIVLPVETRPIEELRDGACRMSSRKRMRLQPYINEYYSEGETTWEKNGELVLGINIIEQINAHIQTDDNDN
jgi:hypothetical protein